MDWRTSKKGWAAVLLAVYFGLDTYGRVASVHDIALFVWQHSRQAVPFLPYIFVLLAIIFFDRDRRRYGKPHPQSLEGRCLKVRDEMRAFLDSLGGEQFRKALPAETDTEYITRTASETGRRWNLLGHYYELNCAAEVSRIFHEFGVRGVHDAGLEEEVRSRKKEEDYKSIIDSLTKLAETPEANTII